MNFVAKNPWMLTTPTIIIMIAMIIFSFPFKNREIQVVDKVPLIKVMSAGQYILISDPSNDKPVYKKKNPDITLTFDFKANTAKKNEFVFDIENKFELIDNLIYMDPQTLTAITNKKISYVDDKVTLEDLDFDNHKWTDMNNGLVAHAGGGINNIDGTNCYEAVITNYNLGHRVFEIDFNMTTDHDLVAVHDWAGYSGAKSVSEWADIKIADVFKSMSLKDVLNIMHINQDMVLVTDTKSFDYADEEISEQFQILYDTAVSIDATLLERIVPQIYNQKMYDIIKSVYPWQSIIYTLYASPDNDRQVLEFVKDKADIKVITMGPVRYSVDFFNQLTKHGKLIYFFTLNDIKQIRESINLGAHGIYTDFVTPSDMDEILYNKR